jgi:hypothetical protein
MAGRAVFCRVIKLQISNAGVSLTKPSVGADFEEPIRAGFLTDVGNHRFVNIVLVQPTSVFVQVARQGEAEYQLGTGQVFGSLTQRFLPLVLTPLSRFI